MKREREREKRKNKTEISIFSLKFLPVQKSHIEIRATLGVSRTVALIYSI